MNNIYLSNAQNSPLVTRKHSQYTPSKPLYTVVQNTIPQPNVFSGGYPFLGSPQSYQKVKVVSSVLGRSTSPVNYIKDVSYVSESKRNYFPSQKDSARKSPIIQKKQSQNSSESHVYQFLKTEETKDEQEIENHKKIIITLTNYYDEIKRIILERFNVHLFTQHEIISFLQQKSEEILKYKQLAQERESIIKDMEKEYENNLGLVSEKVDVILDENSRLRHQLHQIKEEKEEEYDYFKDKQMKFIQEYHEMTKIRKQFDNEVLNASQENHLKIIDIKNQEIDNLVKHIESLRSHFNDNQRFLKEQSEYQLQRLKSLLSNHENQEQMNEYTIEINQLKKELKILKQELKTEKDSKRKFERMIKEYQEHHEKSTQEYELKEEQIEQMIQDKMRSDATHKYMQQEILNLQNENETLNKEIQNLHQLLNQRSVEYQFIQKQIQNEKDEILRMNKHLKDQIRFYQRDNQRDEDQNIVLECLKLKQRLEVKDREIQQLLDELELIQNEKLNIQFQNDQNRENNLKRQIQSQLEINEDCEYDPTGIQEENERLKQKVNELQGQILKYEDQKENIVRLVHEVISENRGSNTQSTDIVKKINESVSSSKNDVI